MSDQVDYEGYILDAALRVKMKELADAYTKRFGEVADDSVEEDTDTDVAKAA